MTEDEAFRRLEETCSFGHGNTVRKRRDCMTCQVLLLVEAAAEERESCAKVADAKAREHIDLVRHFTKSKSYTAANAHERYAMVCNGSDGVAARIRARSKQCCERDANYDGDCDRHPRRRVG